jgi:SPP1 gp7 family putative phage head morphogenesis protein
MCQHHLYVNEQLAKDPSHTTMIQHSYQKDLLKRFNKIKAQITQAIVKDDCFNLVNKLTLITRSSQPVTNVKFIFKTDAEKVEAFMDWLEEMVDTDILEVTKRDGRKIVARNAWQNLYVRSAYQKALSQGVVKLEKAGIQTGITDATITHAFYRPFHADKVGVIYTRNFQALKGITEVMDTSISRVLAEGLSKGLGPIQIARILNKEVDNIGIRRAKVLARTEVMNAHAEGTLNIYEDFGTKEVAVKAEWSTAGWNVCPLCQPKEGKVFNLSEARGMIPFHPNCRCVWIPFLPGINDKKVATRKQRKSKEIKRRGQYDGAMDYIEKQTGKDTYSRENLVEALSKDLKIDLNEAEKMYNSIYDFTGKYFPQIRRACKNPSDAQPYVLELIKSIERFISLSPKYDGEIYRGIKFKYDDAKGNRLIAGLQVGKKINMNGISSWSSDFNSAGSFLESDTNNVFFKLAKSNKSAPIKHLSQYPGENEVIMSKNARFIVKNVTRETVRRYENVLVVELKEVL